MHLLFHTHLFNRIDELELALETALHVNRHLNTEVEALVQRLAQAEDDRRAWQERARQLSRLVALQRPSKGPGKNSSSSNGGGDGAAAGLDGQGEGGQQDEGAQQDGGSETDAQLIQQLASLNPGTAEVKWESHGEAVAALAAKGRAAGWLAVPSEVGQEMRR